MTRKVALVVLAGLALVAPLGAPLAAQDEKTPAASGPPLSPFTAVRVSIVPVQAWKADTAGWSRDVRWPELRLSIDSAVQAILLDRGLGNKWAYPGDVVRTAKRNPTYSTDPYALGVARLRGVELKGGMAIPQLLADNLRRLTALGDTRYALIPIELKAQGESVVLRLVMADTRSRTLVWAGDLLSPAGAGMVDTLATRIANLVIEP